MLDITNHKLHSRFSTLESTSAYEIKPLNTWCTSSQRSQSGFQAILRMSPTSPDLQMCCLGMKHSFSLMGKTNVKQIIHAFLSIKRFMGK